MLNSSWNTFYKRDDSEPIIDYIVLAEFDIDSGSTIRHQYPSQIPNYREDWLAENMLPEGVHNREHDWTYLFLNRQEKQVDQEFWISPSHDNTIPDSSARFLYGLNLVRTKFDSSVRRGAIVKSIALFSRYHFIEIFKSALILSLDKYFENQSISVLEELYNSFSSLSLTYVPRPNPLERSLMRRGVSSSSNQLNTTINPSYLPHNWYYNNEILLGNDIQPIPISIPIYTSPDEVGDINLSLLIRTFRHSTMKIYNAIITKQRILFVGHNQCAGDMSQLVLSAIAMISPTIPGIIRRVFPYCSISDLSFLNVHGYIAAVTNPMFIQRNTWWDLICTVESLGGSGTVQTADEKKAEEAVQKGKQMFSRVTNEHNLHEIMDNKFIQIVLSGIDARLGEHWVQKQFHEYTMNLLLQATDTIHSFPIFDKILVNESIKKSYINNSYRVNILSDSVEVNNMFHDPWQWASELFLNKNNILEETEKNNILLNGKILRNHIRRLQLDIAIKPIDVQLIFEDLDKLLRSEISFQALMYMLPDSLSGISVLCLGLLHSDSIVRIHAVRLLQRMETYPSIQPLVQAMNPFLYLSYKRQSAALNGDSIALTESINSNMDTNIDTNMNTNIDHKEIDIQNIPPIIPINTLVEESIHILPVVNTDIGMNISTPPSDISISTDIEITDILPSTNKVNNIEVEVDINQMLDDLLDQNESAGVVIEKDKDKNENEKNQVITNIEGDIDELDALLAI